MSSIKTFKYYIFSPTQLTLDPKSGIQQPVSGSEIRLEGASGRKGDIIGKYCSGMYDLGLPLMRLDHVDSLNDNLPCVQ